MFYVSVVSGCRPELTAKARGSGANKLFTRIYDGDVGVERKQKEVILIK